MLLVPVFLAFHIIINVIFLHHGYNGFQNVSYCGIFLFHCITQWQQILNGFFSYFIDAFHRITSHVFHFFFPLPVPRRETTNPFCKNIIFQDATFFFIQNDSSFKETKHALIICIVPDGSYCIQDITDKRSILYILFCIHVIGKSSLSKYSCYMRNIGIHIPCYYCNFSVSVSLISDKMVDFFCDTLYFFQWIFHRSQMDVFNFIFVIECFIRNLKQILFQI